MNIKSKDREIIEKFLIDKGKLLLREDLMEKNLLNNSMDNEFLTIAEKIKKEPGLAFEHAIIYKLPILVEGDTVSYSEMLCYIGSIGCMLEKIGFRQVIPNYLILFNYFVSDYLSKEGPILKVGTLRVIVLFNKPKELENVVKNSVINFRWLFDNKNKVNILSYLLFVEYQILYLNAFYELININNVSLKDVSEREVLMKQIIDTIFESPENEDIFKNKFRDMTEIATKEFLNALKLNRVELRPGGFLKADEVPYNYSKNSSLHFHRRLELYSCNFVSEEVCMDNHTFKNSSLSIEKDKEAIINQMEEKIKGISMEIDWKYFLSFLYDLDDSLVLEAKAKGHIFFKGEENAHLREETWFLYKGLFSVTNSED